MSSRLELRGSEVTPVTEITGGIHRRIGDLIGGGIGLAAGLGKIGGYGLARTTAETFEVAKKIRRGLERKPYTE